jgi:hypothetical protein
MKTFYCWVILISVNWGDSPAPLDRVATDILNCFYDLFLTQLVKQATRVVANARSILDLVLCSKPDSVNDLKIILGVSDHYAILFNVDVKANISPSPNRHVFNFKRAKWDELCMYISFKKLTYIKFNVYNNVNEAWDAYTNVILQCNVKRRAVHPWISYDVVKLLRKRDKVYKQSGQCSKFFELKNKAKSAVRNAYNRYMWSLGSKDQRDLWKFMRSKVSSASPQSFLIMACLLPVLLKLVQRLINF